MSVCEVVRLNNHGVDAMAHDQFKDAIKDFVEALSIVKRDLLVSLDFPVAGRVNDKIMMTAAVVEQPIAFTASCQRFSCDSSALEDEMAVHPTPNHSPDSRSAVFREAIYITRSDSADDETVSVPKIASVVLFNLALSFHLLAIQHDKPSTTALNKALKLYELAYLLQMQSDFQSPVLYNMALVHNLAHIHNILMNPASMAECHQHLLSTFMLIITAGQGCILDRANGFFWHALDRLVLTVSVTAPAA